jgi:putative redox protein
VNLTHERVPVADCDECSPEEKAAARSGAEVDVIHCEISVTGPLEQEQTERLLEISQRCPMYRTLASPPKVVSSIAALTAANS